MRKLALAVLLGSACSGGDSIAIDDLQQTLIDHYCSVYVDCGIMDDLDQCRAYFAKTFTSDADLIAAVKAGKVIYHGDKAAECLDLVGGSCDRDQVLGARTNGQVCDDVYEGTVHADGACAFDAECISQDCVIPTCVDACCQGTCLGDTKPANRGSVGAACDNDGDCNGSFCDSQGTHVCTAYLADGASCQTSTQCQSYSCGGTPGVCQALVSEGATCTNSSQCRDVADNCNSQHVCSPGLAVGAACMTSADCQPLDHCDATTKLCAKRPARGDTCTGSYDCIDDSWCDESSTCVAPKADGAACMDDVECSSHTCDALVCTTPAVCI